jgi:tetratricopeptide (TPR) repeat protein
VRQALARADEVGNVRAQALCYHALGAVEYLVGRWPESTAALERSIELADSVGSIFGVVLGMQRLGVVETGLGRYEAAHDRLRRALALVQSSRNPMVQNHSPTRIYTSLTDNRLRAGDLTGAAEYLAAGYDAQQAVAAQGFGECVTCDVLLYPAAVAVHLARREMEQAERAAAKAEEATTWFHSRVWLATARYLRGLFLEARAEPRFAAACFEQAVAIFRQLGQPYDLARCLEALARVTGVAQPREEASRLYAALGASADARRVEAA